MLATKINDRPRILQEVINNDAGVFIGNPLKSDIKFRVDLDSGRVGQECLVSCGTIQVLLCILATTSRIGDMQDKLEQQVITNLAEAFDQAAGEAFEKLCDLMRDGPSSVAFRAVESVLDRSAVAPKRQIHTKQDVGGKVMHVHIPARQLRYMQEVMLEVVDDPAEADVFPAIADDEEMVVEIDQEGEILSERISKRSDGD